MRESVQVNSDACKKRRMDEIDEDGEDIISNLPESIIAHILSLMPTKDVLRTCVLSKDWEYKWTSIYNVDINDRERFSLKTTRKLSVVSFVDRIFILSRNATLKSFRLLCQQKYDTRRMVTWISAALMRDVEDMEIVYSHEGVVVPRCIFNCRSLSNLKLQMPCTVRPVQNWSSNLKYLELATVEILNEHAPNTSQLVFDFPVLETLKLQNCKWLKVNSVEIKAPALTKFDVGQQSNLSEVDCCQIKIIGAKLVKFDIRGSLIGNFDLRASSVICASVDFHLYPIDLQEIRRNGLNARLLLKGCLDLNNLRLSGYVVETIIQSEQGHLLPKFNMLKRLELFSKCDSEAFMQFLHAAPVLEQIRLNMRHWNDYDYDLVESIPSCIVYHLNEVTFVGFKGERSHVHLADFLLKNALELKKMLGLSRKRSDERRAEKNFWARLKGVFGDGDFEVDSSVENMDDFEGLFG